ncbi:MAG TPA: VOC family protein [Pedobacter sp.]|jgi:catechol 2,3-dioxygenase
MSTYTVPASTRIGHVHLKVSDLERSLAFYQEILGFEITQRYGEGAVFLSAGGYHHHIALNTWQSKGAEPALARGVGLYHVAILYAERSELAEVVKRVLDNEYPLSGAADHGVSEAIYLNDPDGNGIELYWDKPKSEWPFDPEGNLQMITEPLNIHGLLSLERES